MDENTLEVFLIVIKNNLNINPLADKGYSYGQIAKFFDWTESNGFIKMNDDVYVLTSKGQTFLNSRNRRDKKSGLKNIWILPQEKFYKTPLDRWAIVLIDDCNKLL
ncbi:MAG: hypothetical protein AB9883_03210 [Acidaminococcaceae bacterium]